MTSSGASESVTVTPGSGAGHQPGRVLELLDPPLVALHLGVVDRLGEGRDVGVQVLHPLLERLVVPGLVADQRREVGVAAGPEVGPLAVVGADHEQRPAQEHHQRRTDAPQPPAAARSVGPVVGGSRGIQGSRRLR